MYPIIHLRLIRCIGNSFQSTAHGLHGDLGAPAPSHAAKEPELAPDPRMDLTMVVAIALDPHLRMKLAIHIAAGKRDTVVGLVFGVVDVIVRGACANN